MTNNKMLYTLLALVMSTGFNANAADKMLTLYHDADWVNHVESAESIWRGVQVALAEVDYQVQGYTLKLVKKNHSGSVLRSLSNLQAFLKDESALAVISGIHSPPLIKNRQFVNENKILTLVPWAAGGPITRYPAAENWVFRVSVDDTKAGKVLAQYALQQKQCKQTHLLLENSAWGDTNLNNINQAFLNQQQSIPPATRFNWGIKSHSANKLITNIIKTNSDCIIFVGNALEGREFALATIEQTGHKPIPIISHWGITAGNFHKRVDALKRKKLDLSFIQTCFSFMQKPLSKKAESVLSKAKTLFPESIASPKDITAPAGFIHGYDSMQLLLGALNSIKLTDNNVKNRTNVRRALENLSTPIEGLLKTYQQPFSPFSSTNSDAHEALDAQDVCMGYFEEDNSIRLR